MEAVSDASTMLIDQWRPPRLSHTHTESGSLLHRSAGPAGHQRRRLRDPEHDTIMANARSGIFFSYFCLFNQIVLVILI